MIRLIVVIISFISFLGSFQNIFAALDTVDVTFVAQNDGSDQKYILMRPDSFQTDSTHDLVIALHGHGSTRWQFATDTRNECKGVRDVANERNMLYVSPDYRGCCSWMGPKAEEDVVQIINDLKIQFSINRVFLCGASMGGTSTLIFTALHPDLIDGIASMNGTANMVEYDNFQSAIQSSYGGTKAEVPDEYYNRSAEYFPESFTMPVGLAVGGADVTVPPHSVLRLADTLVAHERKVNLLYRPTGGHSTSYADARAIMEFAIDSAKVISGIYQPAAPEKLNYQVGPNPARSLITFSAPDAGEFSVTLYRADGMVMETLNGNQIVSWSIVGSVSPGLYFYELLSKDKTVSGTVLISR